MKYAVSVDPGKFATKCKGRSEVDSFDKQIYFETRYYDIADGDIELEGNSCLVEYKDFQWIIGEQGEISDTNITKTSMLHKMAIYMAIAQIVKDDQEPNIVLTVGCPTTIFKNPVLKEEYRDFIAEDPVVIINGISYCFDFEKIIIKCEGSGIVYLESDLFRNQRIAVLDIGGRNINFGIYDNCVAVPSTLFSNNYGSFYLESMIREELNIYFGFDLDIQTVKKAIKEGGIILDGKLNPDSAAIISQVIQKYIHQYIMSNIREKNIPIQVIPVVGVGGTINVVIDSLKKEIPQIRKPNKFDSQWANVEGYHIVCKVKAGII